MHPTPRSSVIMEQNKVTAKDISVDGILTIQHNWNHEQVVSHYIEAWFVQWADWIYTKSNPEAALWELQIKIEKTNEPFGLRNTPLLSEFEITHTEWTTYDFIGDQNTLQQFIWRAKKHFKVINNDWNITLINWTVML